MWSEYFTKLQVEIPDVAERYIQKIKLIGGIDPYNLKDLECTEDGFPPISSIDITSYLVLTNSFYTNIQMKAFKSLEAFKYFEAGFVQILGYKNMGNDFVVILGKVKHSQKMRKESLRTWIICKNDGSVCTGHCTCMAGNSEVCSHIGAILFAVEYIHHAKELSCTDVKAQWMIPSTSNVPVVPTSEMDWGRYTHQEEFLSLVPSIGREERECMLEKLQNKNKIVALHKLIEPFASKLEISEIDFPLHFNLYNESYVKRSYEELLQISSSIEITVTNEEAVKIEEVTRNQSKCEAWFKQRAGRITASKFKAVIRTNSIKPSLSLIKNICYPTKINFFSKAIEWGINNEDTGVKAYVQKQSSLHDDLEISMVGFIINPDFPQFGASPDRYVQCICCGYGCLEIKCPYILSRDKLNMFEFAQKKTTCLIEKDGQLMLDITHSYYFQVQMQLFVTGRHYCDFVVWSPSEVIIQRILPDAEFWEKNSKAAQNFHQNIIIPELLGRFFTRQEGNATIETWCLCEKTDDGRPMIACDGDECSVRWFHLQCVNLSVVPDDYWFCYQCVNKQ